MLREVHIQNFKSIRDLKLEFGRVTVLIGENGCGKSNILEAIAMASAAVADKLDHEFLASRGIRVTDSRFMRSAFERPADPDVRVTCRAHFALETSEPSVEVVLRTLDESPFSEWKRRINVHEGDVFVEDNSTIDQILEMALRSGSRRLNQELRDALRGRIQEEMLARYARSVIPDFLIYSPENTALRTFSEEGQIQPLGIKGEGLFKLLKVLRGDATRFDVLRENLRLLDWFEDLQLPSALAPFEHTLQIRDRFLEQEPGPDAAADAALAYFDQRSANEGFLFLLFYFALFISQHTPGFFAIDNVDASLNPKLCTELTRRLCALAVAHDKQVIITTHNPAVLDGLNLHDPAQQLHVVYRNSKGHTRARRVMPPTPVAGEPPIKLSEAFLRGLLGGLPQNF